MPTDHTLLPTGTAESTHRQGLFRKARLVGLALAATPLLLGFGVSAGPNSEYTFQVIRPQLLATRIIPAYAQYTRSISPVGFERDHGDFHSEFTSPRGRLVTITVKAPVTTRQFDVPPIPSKQTVYDYLNAALYDASGQPRNGTLIRFPTSTYSVDFPFRSNCTSATDHQPKYVHWQLPEGASDIVIDGQGSTINFSDLCLGLNLPAVQRVTIKNFTFAWPNIQIAAVGAIIATGGNGNTEYTYDVALPPFLGANPPRMIAGTTSWDRATNHWDLMHPDDDVSYGDGVTSGIALNCTELPAKRTSTGCTVHDIPSYGVSFTVGEAVLVRYYSFATGISISGNDITLDHITLKNLIGSDFAYSQGRGLHISHLLLTRMADQPLSAVGGGSPLTNIGGDVVIDHSSIGYRSDDAFDMNTTIMRYTPRPVVNNTPMNSFVFDPSHADQLSWPSYNFVQSGDTIAIFDNTLNFKEVAKVVAISAPTNGSTSTLTLDQEIKPPLATQGFIAGDITNSAGARYLISDNEFLFNRARALLGGT